MEQGTDPTGAAELITLGDKFKLLEQIHVHRLDPRKWTHIRLDGRGFSKFTKSYQKPFDPNIASAMVHASRQIMREFNARLAFTQSDEALILIEPIPELTAGGLPNVAQLLFDGRVEKILTIAASLFSVSFNTYLTASGAEPAKPTNRPGIFDARLFQVDTETEALQTVRWRQLDGFRNGIHAIGRSLFTDTELFRVSIAKMMQMIPDAELQRWRSSHLIHGTCIQKVRVLGPRPEYTRSDGVTVPADPTVQIYRNVEQQQEFDGFVVNNIALTNDGVTSSTKMLKYDDRRHTAV